MARKIGDTLVWCINDEENVRLKVSEYKGDPQSFERCDKCFFSHIDVCASMKCLACNRADRKNIFYEQISLEKCNETNAHPKNEPQNREENRKTEESTVESPEKPTEEKPTEEKTEGKTESKKNDRIDRKPRWELLPLPDLEDVVEVYTFGAEKYGPHTWRDLEDGFDRYKAALLRHLVSFDSGEEFDEESGLPALAHMAWNAIAMLAIWHDKQNKKQTENNLKEKENEITQNAAANNHEQTESGKAL